MPDTFMFPSSTELSQIQKDLLPDLDPNDDLLSLFPYRYAGGNEVVWEQEDNDFGLMEVRGLDGKPGLVQKLGFNQFKMKPGYYGSVYQLTEQELTEARGIGTFGDPIDIDDLVVKRTRTLMIQRLNRMRQTISDFCRLGAFTNARADGTSVHSDIFNITTKVPGTAWSSTATATPLKDLRSYKALAERNTSSSFGNKSKLIANSVTINYLLNNTNANDLGGKRLEVGSTINTLEDLNQKILAANNLPQLVEYNKSYQTGPRDRTTFTMFIPDGFLIWVGDRPNGQRLGEFIGTRNINSANESDDGIYSKVIDRGEMEVPRQIEVHHGFNGGIGIYYPTALISIQTS